MKKERSIFDTAHWADQQKYRNEELERYKKQVAELNKRLTEKPIQPEQDVPMEVEETGHAAKIQREKIVEKIHQAADDIKVTLQAPKGYILFPEPPQEPEEPVYIASDTEEVEDNS